MTDLDLTNLSHTQPKPRYGAAYALLAFGMFTVPIMDIIAKPLVMGGMPGAQVALARFIGQGLFTMLLLPIAILLAPRLFGVNGPLTPRMAAHATVADLKAAFTIANFARGVTLASATALFFTGLATIALPASVAILFLAPLILTILGGVVLKEPLTARRILLCLAGFPCVLLITRPGLDGLGWQAIYPLLSACFFAVYFLLTRIASGQGSPLAMHVVTALSGTLALAIWLCFKGIIWPSFQIVWPQALGPWIGLCALGVVSTIAHMAIILAYARAPASVLAPLNYLEIVSATALSYLVFGTIPDLMTVFGALMIMLIGYFATRES